MLRIVQLFTIIALVIIPLSCITGPSTQIEKSLIFPLNNTKQQISSESIENVRQSFLQLRKSANLMICKPETKRQKRKRLKAKKPQECKELNIGAYASSFAILKTMYEKKPGSLVITAAHVCDNTSMAASLANYGKKLSDVDIGYKAQDIDGVVYDAKVLDMDNENDICLLFVENFKGGIVPPTKHRLKPGERVWNIASPVAEFHKGMVPIFQGYYSGVDEGGKGSFTIPAAPGSSGSPIVNSHGELVGILISVHREMNHLSYSPSLPAIYNFILNSCESCNLRYDIVGNHLQSLKLEKK